MNGNDDEQIGALVALKEEIEQAVLRSRRRGRRRLATAYAGSLALIAAGLAFTAPGAALAEKVTSVLGIGAPSTLPPAQRANLEQRERGIVIAAGTTPDGDAYEVVASHAEQAKPLGRLRAGEVFNCLTVDFVEHPDEESTEICLGEGDVRRHYAGAAVIDGVQPGDRYQRPGAAHRNLAEGRYYLYGLVGSGIERIEVAYTDREGQSHKVPAEIGWIDREIAADLGLEPWAVGAGMMIAFLPDDGLPPFGMGREGPMRSEPGHPGSVVITGFDAKGEAVASYDLGKLYSRSLTGAARSWRERQAVQAWLRQRRAEDPGPSDPVDRAAR